MAVIWFCEGVRVGRFLPDGHVSTVVGGHSVWDLGGNWFGEGGRTIALWAVVG